MAFLDRGSEQEPEFRVGDVVRFKPGALECIIETQGLEVNCEKCGAVLGIVKNMDEINKAVRLHAYLEHRDLLEDID